MRFVPKRIATAEHEHDLARHADGAIGSRPARAAGLAIVASHAVTAGDRIENA